MNYAGKNVYISGGSSGIGLAAANAFAAKGANVLIFSIDPDERVAQALEQIRAAATGTGRFESLHVDVSDYDDVQTKLGNAAKSFGPPDVLMNSAGVGGAYYFEQITPEIFDKFMKINVYGTRNTIVAAVPYMKEKGAGVIANVGSVGGLVGVFGYTAYSTSKFAVVGFSDSLRSELRPHGIRVCVLCPPEVDTPMWHNSNTFKPKETVAINKNSGLLKPEQVADALLAGIERNDFLILPNRQARFVHLVNRFAPWLRVKITDRIVDKVQKG